MKLFKLTEFLIGFILGIICLLNYQSYSVTLKNENILTSDTSLDKYERTLKDLDFVMISATKKTDSMIIESISKKNELIRLNHALIKQNEFTYSMLTILDSITYDSICSIDTTYIHKN
jgi:hypothetical protein